jgi:hypothetical protein
LKRAASGKLEGNPLVMVQLQEIESGTGRIVQVDIAGFAVESLRRSAEKVFAELGPNIFRLSGNNGVGDTLVIFLRRRRKCLCL